MRTRLDMHDHAVGPGLGESFEVGVGRRDHEMHVEKLVGQRPDGLHDLRPDRQVRDEMPVHDIDVNPIGARGDDRAHFLSKPGEIGGKD